MAKRSPRRSAAWVQAAEQVSLEILEELRRRIDSMPTDELVATQRALAEAATVARALATDRGDEG